VPLLLTEPTGSVGLALAGTVVLGFESRGTRHILYYLTILGIPLKTKFRLGNIQQVQFVPEGKHITSPLQGSSAY
jgi:hypothetical protein